MIPLFQFMAGICVGLIGMAFVRQRPMYETTARAAKPRERPTVYMPPPNPVKKEEDKSYVHNPVKKEEDKSKPGDDCVICEEMMLHFDMKKYPCTHAVHKSCFELIRELEKNCPICG